MSLSNFLRGSAVAIALIFAGSVTVSAADAAPKPSGKWKLHFDHWAESDGDLVLRIAPVQGDPVDVTVKVPKGTTENTAADLTAGSLEGALGGGYKVEVDDGEEVVIKAKGKTPKFVVTMPGAVAGLNVKIKRS